MTAKAAPRERFDFLGSIRFRITGLFVVIFGSTLIAFSALLYSAFLRNHQAEFDADLFNHALDVSHAITMDIFGNIEVDQELLSSGGKIFPFSVGRAFLQIVTHDGKIVARSRTLGQASLPLFTDDWGPMDSSPLAAFHTIHPSEVPNLPAINKDASFRLLTYKVTDRGPQPFVLQVAVSEVLLDQERHGLLAFFLFTIPFTLVIAALGGWFVSGSAFSPVTAIIDKAKALGRQNLSDRLPVPKADDEIRRLSLTLNELLDRLQRAFESQERFVADASHELKTPLAIMRGELDVLKRHERDPAELKEFIESASQELGHLSRLVEDLLLLARADAGAASLSIQTVRLDEILLEVVSRLERVAKAKEVKLRLDLFADAFDVEGDPNLLQSMFQNLAENAIKFSPASAMVEVRLTVEENEFAVAISDHGPGIPPELLPRIFERFYRGKTVTTPGFGLGLTIARRIADAHGATLSVESQPTGTTFVVKLPKPQRAAT